MPIEYFLAAGVALILLVLLVFALGGKKSRRVVMQKNSSTDELTRQVARAADALEALLAHLKASPQAVTPASQPSPARQAAVAPPRVEQVTVRAAEIVPEATKAQPPLAPPIPEPATIESAVSEPTPAEAVAATEEAHVEQKPRRVKLSMFGR